MDWPSIRTCTSEGSQAKIDAFERWVDRSPSLEAVTEVLSRWQEGLYPAEDAEERQMAAAERRWRWQQREDYRNVYAKALEKPAEAASLLEAHAGAIVGYQEQIKQLEAIDRAAQELFYGRSSQRGTWIKRVSVVEARQQAGSGGWHVLLHPKGFAGVVARQRKALVNGELGGPNGIAYQGLAHLLDDDTVVIYNNLSQMPQLTALIARVKECIYDISHVQLRLCRAARVHMAIELYQQLVESSSN